MTTTTPKEETSTVNETYRDHELPETVSADLGVGHVWTAVQCPAYRTSLGRDCTCDNFTHRNKAHGQ